MVKEKVTIWNSVPALMRMLVEDITSLGQRLPDSLRLVMMSGDWIPVSLPDRIRCLAADVQIVSLGGATEASIWSILYPIKVVSPDWQSIPYGRPMVNQSFHVLNEALEPCPIWVTGHLYIGGIGLAKGYWRDEQKTCTSFITHPKTGERLYRTGDLGRYLPDGNIEFLGREDFQVKVQGYRIELGEIEAVLGQHPAVRHAIVTAIGERAGNKKLVAYVVLQTDQPETFLDESEFRHFLRQKLPDYMIPSTFITLEALPLSTNGKIDRQALPSVELSRPEAETNFVPPRTSIEESLANIWSDLLRIEKVGVNDDFFEIGGDSMLSVQMNTQIRETFKVKLPLRQIFETPNIADLAEHLEALTIAQTS
jgi:acyl-coenzyme A synthetase/AMP-(fatty) acid ligase/acyl carrier protein